MSEVDRTVSEVLGAVIDYLEFITKQNPNDADLGGEVRKFTKSLLEIEEIKEIRNKYRNYE